MGVSTKYEVIPEKLLRQIESEPELCSAFEAMWCCGSGVYHWFDKMSRSEIAEITEDHSPDVIRQLEILIEPLPKLADAHIEKTHEMHEAMLKKAFVVANATDVETLVKRVIFGDQSWKHGDLGYTSNECCKFVAKYLKRIDVDDLVANVDLAGRTPAESWRDSLHEELQGLVDCYCCAARGKRIVMISVC